MRRERVCGRLSGWECRGKVIGGNEVKGWLAGYMGDGKVGGSEMG